MLGDGGRAGRLPDKYVTERIFPTKANLCGLPEGELGRTFQKWTHVF